MSLVSKLNELISKNVSKASLISNFKDTDITKDDDKVVLLAYLWSKDVNKVDFDIMFNRKDFVDIGIISSLVKLLYKNRRDINRTSDFQVYGLTSSLKKRISKYLSKLSKDFLEFQSIFYKDFAVWKNIIDLCHIKENNLKYSGFVKYVMQGSIEPDTLLYKIQNNGINISTIEEYPNIINYYSAIRTLLRPEDLGSSVKVQFLLRAPLEDVFWHWNELTRGVDVKDMNYVEKVLYKKLNSGVDMAGDGRKTSSKRTNYGRLLQQILLFKKNNIYPRIMSQLIKRADDILVSVKDEFRDFSRFSVAILGDASASMQVAVETSSVIASLLSIAFNADISFFNESVIKSPIEHPRNVNDVLEITRDINANGSTSPAAALYPYLVSKKFIDVFIVVTDEEENTNYNGNNFCQAFIKYRNNVNKYASIFFVSFLQKGVVGQMGSKLIKYEIMPKTCCFHREEPDLSKLDNLLDELVGFFKFKLKKVNDDKRDVDKCGDINCRCGSVDNVDNGGDGDVDVDNVDNVDKLYKNKNCFIS